MDMKHRYRPGPLFQLTQALADALRDFDLILETKMGHEKSSYVTRRIWDYFVRHLMGVEPPKEMKITQGSELAIQKMMAKAQASTEGDQSA